MDQMLMWYAVMFLASWERERGVSFRAQIFRKESEIVIHEKTRSIRLLPIAKGDDGEGPRIIAAPRNDVPIDEDVNAVKLVGSDLMVLE